MARTELPLVGLPVSVSWWGCRYWGILVVPRNQKTFDTPVFYLPCNCGFP